MKAMTEISSTEKEKNHRQQLLSRLSELVYQAGYELVTAEILNGRERLLRIYIDHLSGAPTRIGVEDCAKVSRFLDEPLEALPELSAYFSDGMYSLEVSSPGINRPLRLAERSVSRPPVADCSVHPPPPGERKSRGAFPSDLAGFARGYV